MSFNYSLLSPIDVKSSSVTGQINLCSSGSSNAVQVKAPTLAANVPLILPSTAGTTGQFLQLSSVGGQTTWTTVSSSRVAGDTLPIVLSFMEGATPAVGHSVTSATPVIIHYFIYGGSTTSSTPTTATFVYSTSVGATAPTFTIRNVPGGVVVVTLTPSASTSIVSVSTSSFTTIPTTQTYCSVLVSLASGTCTIYSISLI